MSPRLNHSLTVIICLLFLAGCESGSQIAAPSSEPPSPKPKPPQSTQGSDASTDDAPPTMIEPDVYPSYTFSGIGSMTYDSDTFQSTSSIETTVSEEELVITQSRRTVDLRGKGGSDKQREADDKIRRQSIGPTKYRRSTVAEKRTLGEDNVPYVIFASGVTTVSGRSYTFSSPVPVFPIPGKESRYGDLNGTKTFRSEVSCTGCPMASKFAINVSVTKLSAGGGKVSLKFETSIEAQGIVGGIGAAYHGFPLAKTATFVIDTEKSLLMSLDSLHLFLQNEASNGAASGPEERSTMAYKICSFDKGTMSEKFTCP